MALLYSEKNSSDTRKPRGVGGVGGGEDLPADRPTDRPSFANYFERKMRIFSMII